MSEEATERTPISRRDMLRLLGGTLAVAASSRVLKADSPVSDSSERHSAATRIEAERRYRGTATTTFNGSRFTENSEKRSITHDIEVTLSPPVRENRATPNAFELAVSESAKRSQPAAPGLLMSSRVAIDRSDGEQMQRRWEIQAGENGVFSGVLRTPDAESSVLTSRRELIPGHQDTVVVVTEAMAGGTTLTGTITKENVDITISGNTQNRFAGRMLDRTNPFESEIRATRVDG